MRSYQKAISNDCPESCVYCPHVGGVIREGAADVNFPRSLRKADSGKYEKFILTCSAPFLPDTDRYIRQIAERQLAPVVQINERSMHSGWRSRWREWSELGAEFEVVFDRWSRDSLPELEFLLKLDPDLKLHLVVHRQCDVESALQQMSSEALNRVRVSFPLPDSGFKKFLSCSEVFNSILRWKKRWPEVKWNLPEGRDLFEPRVSESMSLEPLVSPSLRSQVSDRLPQVSVVIPSYNSKDYLLNTLDHLFEQDLAKEDYEVIVVDDGSDDGTEEGVRNWLFQGDRKINFKYLDYQRPRKRAMGDGQFRAGLARNLGVKWAEGELLVFLDSDILTPKNYLKQLYLEHADHELIQTQRIYLRPEKSSRHTKYAEIDVEKDSYHPEGGYWKEFFSSQQKWQEMPVKWKYVCTYGLSVPKKVFQELGWFRKTYLFYGFEDTDFGYRMAKAGFRFHLSRLQVLHLDHSKTRSESRGSDFRRHLLLQKTARIFFLNNLDPEIYRHLSTFIRDRWWAHLKLLCRRIFS